MATSKRAHQVGELIAHQVALLLKKEVSDPRLQEVSITGVDLSPDLSNAKIFYTLISRDAQPEVDKALKRATGFLRHKLTEAVQLRYIPNIHFVYDETLVRAERINSLLSDIDDDEA